MELGLLRTFVTVTELRHFAKAAAACNLSQPAVSHQIARLEEDIGARLLNRTGRRVSLTVAGEVLLEEARRILAAVDRARERLQDVTSGAVGRIRLGASPTPGLYLLPPLLATYRRQHPNFDLQLQIASIHELADRVARNDLDMAVVTGPAPGAELQSRPLVRDGLVLIGPTGSRLARTPRLRPAHLARECWILREEGSETRRQVASWLQRHRIAPARTMTFDGPDAVKRAVMGALGIALVSRLTIERDLADGSVTGLAITTALPSREICVIDHPQKHHGAACRAMLALLLRLPGGTGQ